MSRKFIALLLAALLLLATETASLASSTVTMRARINPLVLKVRNPRRVRKGDVFRVRARVLNIGDRTLRYARVRLILPKGLALIETPMRQDLGRLYAGGEKVAIWRVKANSRGKKVVKIKAAARFNKTSPFFTAGKTRTIRVRKPVTALFSRDAIIRFFVAVNTRIKNLVFP